MGLGELKSRSYGNQRNDRHLGTFWMPAIAGVQLHHNYATTNKVATQIRKTGPHTHHCGCVAIRSWSAPRYQMEAGQMARAWTVRAQMAICQLKIHQMKTPAKNTPTEDAINNENMRIEWQYEPHPPQSRCAVPYKWTATKNAPNEPHTHHSRCVVLYRHKKSTTAHQAGPMKDPVPNKTPHMAKTKPNGDTKQPSTKNPHEPHPLWRVWSPWPPSIPLPPDLNPANNGPQTTSFRTRPPHMTKTTPNEDMKRHNAKNPHKPHPPKYSSDPMAHTYLQPIPLPL
ncbi:hypothetical protein BS47DRAFT_1360758 [Hydnum rufescens UP504]|uniref:Uncharacterized protein n=1 Tax=Hydnum rufescens UP504 TaxID=1448309 RepID=A0A9P6DUW8_9AGAM|nr:hypothetical protein BS47DRAFT_1360758 [Hydnum rufescens UP504]